MTAQSLPVARKLAEAFPWGGVRTVVDIGTAQGCVPVELALAHPHLIGGGFDLPAVEAIFSRYVASKGLSERLRFTAGDFLVDDLPRADVLIMGMILHDWDLPTKRMLIGKAYAALEKGGSLIVYEFLIDDERKTHLPGLLMSLNMLIETRGGFDYTGADCTAWMRDAGFTNCRVVPLTGTSQRGNSDQVACQAVAQTLRPIAVSRTHSLFGCVVRVDCARNQAQVLWLRTGAALSTGRPTSSVRALTRT
jgi:hypothetical protein